MEDLKKVIENKPNKELFGLLTDIELASSGRYEKEISRQIRRQLYLFEKEMEKHA